MLIEYPVPLPIPNEDGTMTGEALVRYVFKLQSTLKQNHEVNYVNFVKYVERMEANREALNKVTEEENERKKEAALKAAKELIKLNDKRAKIVND